MTIDTFRWLTGTGRCCRYREMLQRHDAGGTTRSISGSTAVLTTYRRDGNGVNMLVSIAIRDGLMHFVTATNSGKAKRLRRNSRVSLVTRAGARRVANEPGEGHPTPAPESGWERCTAVRQADALVGRKFSLVRAAARRRGAISVVLAPRAPPIAGGASRSQHTARARAKW